MQHNLQVAGFQLPEQFLLLPGRRGSFHAFRFIAAFVPDDDGAGSIVPFRDHAFEAALVYRMVFHHHGELLVGRPELRAFGYVPAFEYVFQLQPEIVMQL